MHTTAFMARKPKEPKQKEANPVAYKCDHCGKAYKREKSFLTHVCLMKERFLHQDEKANKTGFLIFQKFWSRNYRTAVARTYEDFAKSGLFKVLVSFGKYLHDINAVRPDCFVDFLLKGLVPVDRWQSPAVYETYLRELNKTESPGAALERNVLLMERWAIDTGECWTDFFRKVPTTLATMWINSGRISPWVLYTASSAEDLMLRMTDEQLTLIHKNLDPKFWTLKLDKYADEVAVLREELREFGL